MNGEEKIDKIFGIDRTDRCRKIYEKSPFINLRMDSNSNLKKDNKLLKQEKINISSFEKQFTNVENIINSKNKKKSSGYIDINNYFALKSYKNEKEKEDICKSNKIYKIKSNVNPVSKESKSSNNIVQIKNVSLFNKNNIEKKNTNEKKNNIEKKSTSEKKNGKIKKKKESLNIINNNNLDYMIQKVTLIENRNIFDEVQRAIQFEIKTKKNSNSNENLIIERIKMPNYIAIKKKENDNQLIKESKNPNSNIIKDNTNETGNNFKSIYKVNNKKNHFLCCI